MLYLRLRFANECRLYRFLSGCGDQGIIVRSNLAIIERKISLLPRSTPAIDQSGKHIGIGMGTIRIVFSLIPDDTTHSDTDERMQHTIVKGGRCTVWRGNISISTGNPNFGEGTQHLLRHPCFGSRSSPRSNDKPHRDIQKFIQQPPEIIGSRAKFTHSSRHSFVPRTGNIILRKQGRVPFHCK